MATVRRALQREGLTGAPVVDGQGRFEGTVSLSGLGEQTADAEHRLASVVDVSAPTVSEVAHLDIAVDAMSAAAQHWVPVLDVDRKVVGTVATSDVVRGYRLGLLARLQSMGAGAGAGGSDRVLIEAGSRLAGQPLRQTNLPVSIIVTTIQRHHDLVVPDGTTVLESGDELFLIGNTDDIDATRVLASRPRSSAEAAELPARSPPP